MPTSLVVTVIGTDRPGIVNELADVARRAGANWAASRMASLAGQFAGIVHFEVPSGAEDSLTASLRALAASGLEVVIATGRAGQPAPDRRRVRLELVGNDRPGIVRDLSGNLAAQGVSIDELDTEVVSAAMSGERLFRMTATLAVPAALADDDLQKGLEALANELMVDIDMRDDRAVDVVG